LPTVDRRAAQSGSTGGLRRLRVPARILPAAFTAAALLLTAAFLGEHRLEFGAVPLAVRSFAAADGRRGILDPAGAGQSAAGAAVAMLVVLAWYGLGDLVAGAIQRVTGTKSAASARSSPAVDIASTCALGAGTWSLVCFAGGLAGLYRPSTAVAALLCGLLLAARAALRSSKSAAGTSTVRDLASEWPAASCSAALVAMAILLAFVSALAPPTAKDALQYHRALPKAFVAGGGLVDVPGNIATYFALGAEMHGVWALVLGQVWSARAGEAAFGAVMFAFFPLLVAAVFGWVRERELSRTWAWLAAAMVASTPVAWEEAGGGYVDLALALYVTLGIRAVVRWWDTQSAGDLLHAIAALGFALAVKLTAAFAVLILALIVLVRIRESAGDGHVTRARLLLGLMAPVAAVALAAPWYLRTWYRTGSPVFPFFAGLWPGHAPGWDIERSAMLIGFNALYGAVDQGPLGYLIAPLLLSVSGQREVAARYESVLGVAFLCGAVLIIWAIARRALHAEWKIAAAAAGALFAWWLGSAQVLRYLLPALPLIAVSAAGAGIALGHAGGGRIVQWAMLAAITAAELVAVAWFAADNPVLAVTGAEPREAYLERRLDYYSYYRAINDRLTPADTVWLVDMRHHTYHLARRYQGDYLFEDYTLRKWIETASTGKELQRRARAAGITHVLIRHDILLDPARSPLADERAPPAETAARFERLRAFLIQGVTVLRADPKFALIELPAVGEGSRQANLRCLAASPAC